MIPDFCAFRNCDKKHSSQVEMPPRIHVVMTLTFGQKKHKLLCRSPHSNFLLFLLPKWLEPPDEAMVLYLWVVDTRKTVSGCNCKESSSGYGLILPHCLIFLIVRNKCGGDCIGAHLL